MKKRAPSRIASFLGRIFNFRYWLDYNRLKVSTSYLVKGAKRLLVPQKPVVQETFNKAVTRLKLSEVALLEKQKSLFRLSMLMLGLAALIFCYAVYQIFFGFKAVLVSLALMLVALALAFRYHFWYFQIKERKLGCSLKEWYQRSIMGAKHE